MATQATTVLVKKVRAGCCFLTLGQLVILLQVAEPLLGGCDVVALVLWDVLLAGRLELLQVFVGDVFREVAEQRGVLRHDLLRHGVGAFKKDAVKCAREAAAFAKFSTEAFCKALIQV